MRLIFDYLFYKVYCWNTKIIKQNDPSFFYTIVGVSALCILNYTTILLVIFLLSKEKILSYSTWIQICAMIFIVCFCFYYYLFRRKGKEIIHHCKKLNSKQVKKLNFLVSLYIVGTIVTHILIVILVREN